MIKTTAFKSLCSFILLLACLFSVGQKNDYVWLTGYSSNSPPDSLGVHHEGISKMDFNSSPCAISYDSLGMSFDVTNTSFSTDSGSLLFYTNGIYIANWLDEKIENADSLNAGPLQYWWDPSIQEYGYRAFQGIIALPAPGNANQYYILHTYTDTFNAGSIITSKLLYTLLDMSANNGHGKVIFKNQPLIIDNIGEELTAVKHGNGQDWWIIVQKRGTNCYYKVLLDDRGVHLLPTRDCGGGVTTKEWTGSTCFSPDGNKYIYLGGNSGVNIFDFDRCKGTLSNAINIPMPVIQDSFWYGYGVAVSPNSRFLYVTVTFQAYQYDLEAPNIQSWIDTVALYDYFISPFQTYFTTMQLAPDGKIYCASFGNNTMHVIKNPNQSGDSCVFSQHDVSLPAYSLGIPNYPNYRLGALPGSACDTLTSLNETARAEKEKILKTFPNPATDYIVIDYGFTDWNKGGVTLEIQNELGQTMYTQNLPMYSGFQKIDVSSFTNGFYIANIKRQNTLVATAKFVKQ